MNVILASQTHALFWCLIGDNFLRRTALYELRALSIDREVLEWLNWLEGRLPKDRRV